MSGIYLYISCLKLLVGGVG